MIKAFNGHDWAADKKVIDDLIANDPMLKPLYPIDIDKAKSVNDTDREFVMRQDQIDRLKNDVKAFSQAYGSPAPKLTPYDPSKGPIGATPDWVTVKGTANAWSQGMIGSNPLNAAKIGDDTFAVWEEVTDNPQGVVEILLRRTPHLPVGPKDYKPSGHINWSPSDDPQVTVTLKSAFFAGTFNDEVTANMLRLVSWLGRVFRWTMGNATLRVANDADGQMSLTFSGAYPRGRMHLAAYKALSALTTGDFDLALDYIADDERNNAPSGTDKATGKACRYWQLKAGTREPEPTSLWIATAFLKERKGEIARLDLHETAGGPLTLVTELAAIPIKEMFVADSPYPYDRSVNAAANCKFSTLAGQSMFEDDAYDSEPPLLFRTVITFNAKVVRVVFYSSWLAAEIGHTFLETRFKGLEANANAIDEELNR